MRDFEDMGPEKTAQRALELAWDGCNAVYMSFDIDSIDPGYAPGTGSPELGGFTPREVLEMVRIIAGAGLCALEVVEVAPPYDVNDNTSQLACPLILDALSAMIKNGKLGHRDAVLGSEKVGRVVRLFVKKLMSACKPAFVKPIQ